MDFSELLSSDGPVILDGAMGTELERRGCPGGGVQCLQNPQTVADIHRECVAAGSQVIITNSLTMNRAYLESHGLDVSVRKVNTAAARLARSTGDVFVLGNLSSSGSLLAPYGEKSEEELVGVFQEQALYLTRGGVDGLIIPNNDPTTISNAINHLMEDADLRKLMGVNARKTAERYDWNNIVDLYRDLYKKIITEKDA